MQDPNERTLFTERLYQLITPVDAAAHRARAGRCDAVARGREQLHRLASDSRRCLLALALLAARLTRRHPRARRLGAPRWGVHVRAFLYFMHKLHSYFVLHTLYTYWMNRLWTYESWLYDSNSSRTFYST